MSKECKRCGRDVVHDKRKWCLCLDCVCDLFLSHSHNILYGKAISNPTDMNTREGMGDRAISELGAMEDCAFVHLQGECEGDCTACNNFEPIDGGE
ncbi:MAG: hypothetical protein ACTSPB_00020 [Candidatus Thorarchaeota archaeon]